MQLLVNSPQSPALWQMSPPPKKENTHTNEQLITESHSKREVKTPHLPPHRCGHFTWEQVTWVSAALPTADLTGMQPTHLIYCPTSSHLTTAAWDKTKSARSHETNAETMNMFWCVGIPSTAGIQHPLYVSIVSHQVHFKAQYQSLSWCFLLNYNSNITLPSPNIWGSLSLLFTLFLVVLCLHEAIRFHSFTEDIKIYLTLNPFLTFTIHQNNHQACISCTFDSWFIVAW